MEEDLEQRIRERAHDIWVREGRPHGRDQDHWDQARRELADGEGAAVQAVETEAASGRVTKGGRGGKGKKEAPASTPSEAASTAREGTKGRRGSA